MKLIKILIVEDFLPDRENLKDIIGSFENLGISIAGECENGLQALKLIGELKPDIIVSDIEMPFMDGLELAKNVRRDYPEIKIIFQSLYNEFEYARKALYLDSYGYILKPVNPVELKECICKASQKDSFTYDKEEYKKLRTILEQSKPVLMESLIKDLLFGLYKNGGDLWERMEFLGLKLGKGLFIVSYIEIDDFEKITGELKIESKQLFSIKIHERIKEIIHGIDKDIILSKLDEAHFVFISSYPSAIGSEEAFRKLSEDMEKVLFEFKRTDISLSVAISDTCDEIDRMSEMFEQCRYIMKYKYILGKGIILTGKDIPNSTGSKTIDFNSIQKEIRFLLNSGSRTEIESYVEYLHASISGNTDETYLKNLYFCIVISVQIVLNENNECFENLFIEEKSIWEKLLKFETILDSSNWLKNILLFINDYLQKKANRKNKVIIREVKQYIEENLTKSISLAIIASDLYYSPNYLNHVFKQETGETITDFITRRKIEKAKELLSDPKIKAFEISEILGYCHPSYFANVFKKYTGLTPNDYRERYLI